MLGKAFSLEIAACFGRTEDMTSKRYGEPIPPIETGTALAFAPDPYM